MILLSLLAFLGSPSANVDSRKPVNRETITQQKLTAKRSIPLHYARQHLASLDFFRGVNQLSLIYSLPQHEIFLRTEFEHHNKKSRPREIQKVVQLHAPRSADPITASSKG